MTSPSGALSCLTTLAEPTHRRLLSLTTQLLSVLPSYAGLNTKAYRQSGQGGRNVGVDSQAGRSATIVDGSVLARWNELGSVKKMEIAGKSGFDGLGEMRAELEGVVGWSGLAYF